MERHIAVKKLRKLLGKSFGYRVDASAPTKEQRQAASAELPAAIKVYDDLRQRADARRQAILQADSEYKMLIESCTAARKHKEKLFGKSRHFKITVGNSSDLFFHVKAEGDSWEEIFDKLAKERRG